MVPHPLLRYVAHGSKAPVILTFAHPFARSSTPTLPKTTTSEEENVIISKIIMIEEGAHSPLATASIGTRRQTVATSADHDGGGGS